MVGMGKRKLACGVFHNDNANSLLYSLADLEGGRYFFNAVREGDSIVFASDDENECHLWVMAMYRATGQSHKPTPPLTLQDKNSTISKIQGGINSLVVSLVVLRQNNFRCGSSEETRHGGLHLSRSMHF